MLKENSNLKELDLSESWSGLPQDKRDGPGFAQELADGVKNNGALVKFTISGERYYDNGYKDAPPVTIEASMTEADFSRKHLGTSGAIMLAAFLPKCR